MSTDRIARRIGRIQPFHVMDILAKAKQLEQQGADVVHMEIGEPDFPTPQVIVQAAHQALAAGHTQYTQALGLPALRETVAGHYQQRFGVAIPARRVALTPGASGALLLALGVLLDPGDEVLMADPGYPCNRHFVELLEGRPVSIPVNADSGYQLTAQRVAQAWTPKTKAVLVASPSNPTGTQLAVSELEAIYRTVQRLGGSLIVDEIYHQLVFDQSAYTALQTSPDVIVINSFSKYFGMTGWRLGWLVAPDDCMEAIDRLAQNIFLSAPTLSQYAALVAFSEEVLRETEWRRQEFKTRRDFLVPALRELGFTVSASPQGAFYVYAGCAAHADDSQRFALELLEQQRVAVTPGKDFGSHCPKSYVRFAYTTDVSRLEIGIERMRQFLRAVGPGLF